MQQLHQRQEHSDRTLQRLRDVFGGDREDPTEQQAGEQMIQSLEAELDEAIHYAYSDAGKRAPRTAALEVRLAQQRLEAAKERIAFQNELGELKGRLGHVSHPEYVADQKAYDDLTMFVDRSLRQLYGEDPKLGGVRQAQTEAISKQMVKEIKQFQKEDPQGWQQLRRDPNRLAQWTNNIIKDNIPPQARKIIEQEQMKNYQFSQGELVQALREAREKMPDGPEKRKITENIRRDLLSGMFQSRGRNRR